MNRRTLIIIIAIALFVVIAILAGQVGGLAIRTVPQNNPGYILEGPEQASRGVPSLWTFNSPAGIANTTVSFQLRTAAGTRELAKAPLSDGRVTITFPCDGVDKPQVATLSGIDARTQELLFAKEFQLLADGQDCLFTPN